MCFRHIAAIPAISSNIALGLVGVSMKTARVFFRKFVAGQQQPAKRFFACACAFVLVENTSVYFFQTSGGVRFATRNSLRSGTKEGENQGTITPLPQAMKKSQEEHECELR